MTVKYSTSKIKTKCDCCGKLAENSYTITIQYQDGTYVTLFGHLSCLENYEQRVKA